ncbi:MAG: isoleucine--tRNA ligase [Actinomycetota bacterium]|nr:isoleucine--tRNA ligase [Actinomycetota bacterium]
MTDTQRPYPDVAVRADYPEIERRILAGWKDEKTFERSVEQRSADREYVFFDGPPFANGLPHYGHLLTGYVKDVIPRYHTMRGERVERRFGWDCHGLPAEMESEKELGVSGRKAIVDYGIGNFNDHCRTSVLRYTKEWEDYVTRQARWVDFENDYKTMDLSYMESVMWAFSELWKKGLVYEAYRVMPYSWGAQTPLSNFEIRLDDATRPRQDPALTVAFTLEPRDGEPETRILAWTTTPWTLPSNLALAVGPDVDYAVVEDADGLRYVLGADAIERYEHQLDGTTRVDTVKGADLVGRTYTPLFDYFADEADAFRVLGADFVDTAEGTGVVHMAPGFGEDDQRVCEENGIGLVVPVDDAGEFTEEVRDFVGMNVFDANPEVIRHLKDAGRIVRHDTYTHNYPHCWRTDTPIIYRAVSSWYVEVTKFRDRMIEHNKAIRWIPEHVRDGAFGKWLEGARDWSISRNRFWGAPIPVWRSDDPTYPRVDVYSSLDEIERDFGVRPTDLHRPYVDDLTRPNPDDPTGKSVMRRVPEVLDCWFESGSMPFAQAHYPFENKEWVEANNADFIVEYIAQTRGWFYTMHVLSVALFDRPAFQNCICHGVVQDEEGRKLSKRLRNYPDPETVFETIGSDALRWYLMSSPILRGGDLRIDRDGAGISDSVRLVLNPIWNTFHFFTLYANVEGYQARRRTDSPQLLDRYILAKTRELVEEVSADLDAYEIAAACADVATYLDALTNWYVRRSRDRFWGGDVGERGLDEDAFDTLYTVLETVARTVAPLLPFVAEEIYRGLTGEESVHLADYPDPAELPADHELVARMDTVREAASAALSLRETHGLRTRLPLASLTIAGPAAEAVEPLAALLRDEVNVKEVRFSDDIGAFGSFVLRPNSRVLGPRLGPATQVVIKAAKAGDWSSNDDGSVTVGGHTLDDGEFELVLETGDGQAAAALRGNTSVVSLDVDVTPELAAEGTARDLVRLVQQARRDAGLKVSDRITLTLALPDDLRSTIAPHEGYLADQVLATSVVHTDAEQPTTCMLDGREITLSVAVAG